MAGTIRITPEELRDGATTIGNDRDAVIAQVESIRRTIDDVASRWEGAAQGAFVASFDELYPTIHDQFPEILTGIVNQLNTAAQVMEETDQQLQSALSGK